MPIAFNCPSCGTFTEVADQYAGLSGPCKSCGATVTVPSSPATPPSKPLPAPHGGGQSVVAVLAVVIFGFVLVAGVLVALLLPATSLPREASRRMQCGNHLKHLALAMHNYHDTYKSFPPAYTEDAEGNRLHSWRTLLLPFLEQAPLYDQIDLSKPWDAPENRHLTETPLAVFQCPSHPEDGSPRTDYMLIVGPGALFEGSEGPRMRDILDGTSNTIMIVEVKHQGLNWAEPTDLSLDDRLITINASAADPGSYHPGGSQIALADGSVRFIAETTSPELLRKLITRAGGEAVQVP